MVACITPIFIGVLHTFTHFKDLLRPEVQQYLQKEIIILGESQIMWNSWGLVSFMMGASFIVIGLLNLSIWTKTAKSEALPILPFLAMIIYQLSVIYVGYEYEQAFQFYGGIFGGLVITSSLLLTLKHNAS